MLLLHLPRKQKAFQNKRKIVIIIVAYEAKQRKTKIKQKAQIDAEAIPICSAITSLSTRA